MGPAGHFGWVFPGAFRRVFYVFIVRSRLRSLFVTLVERASVLVIVRFICIVGFYVVGTLILRLRVFLLVVFLSVRMRVFCVRRLVRLSVFDCLVGSLGSFVEAAEFSWCCWSRLTDEYSICGL